MNRVANLAAWLDELTNYQQIHAAAVSSYYSSRSSCQSRAEAEQLEDHRVHDESSTSFTDFKETTDDLQVRRPTGETTYR